MEAKEQSPRFYVSEHRGQVSLLMFPSGCNMHLSMQFGEAEARRLAASLIAQADKLPRIAEAGDLGIAA